MHQKCSNISCPPLVYSVFIDYEKCFDKINRSFLWQKLLTENVSSKMTKSLMAMYSQVKSAIKHNGEISEYIDSHIGVKQGDSSSSLLFMMFVNDIIENINTDLEGIFTPNEIKLFLVMFADDQVLFSTSPISLQSMLKDIETYCNTWGLKINTNKTKVLIFENSKKHTNYNFFLNDHKLEVVTSFKYLGVYFFKNGNWHRTQKCIAEHASKAMHKLFSIFNQYEFKMKDKCKLFDVLVSSVLNYAAEIWGYNQAINIEMIHTKFLRKLLCVNKSTNLDGLYGELGRFPLIIMRKIHMFRYWIKIINSDDNTIIKLIYNMLKDDANNNITYNKLNWAYQIKSMLEKLGLSDIWLNQNKIIINIQLIKQRLFDQYYQEWNQNIDTSRRLRTYCQFKNQFQLEPYLENITNRKFKIALTRFRLSSHSLEIERGRYFNILPDDRKCKFCTLNCVENEYHFLLICPSYREIRKKYLKQYYCRWPSINKFKQLMMSENKKEIIALSKYLYFAGKYRTNLELELTI